MGRRTTTAVVATALLVTTLTSAAAAAPDSVRVVLEHLGSGQAVHAVEVRQANPGDAVTVALTSPVGTLTTSQLDPGSDGVDIAVEELGWVPAGTGVDLRIDDGTTSTDLALPAMDLAFGSEPNVVTGRGPADHAVQVQLFTGDQSWLRDATTDGSGRFTVDFRTGGAGDRAPADWALDTFTQATFDDVSLAGTPVDLTLRRSTPRATVVLDDRGDRVTVDDVVAGEELEVFGRTTLTGARRDETGDVAADPTIRSGDVEVAIATDTEVDVTSWDADDHVASGTGPPGANLRLELAASNGRGTSNNGTFVDVGEDGTWSYADTRLADFAGGGTYPDATITVIAQEPSADGITYGRTRHFGEGVGRAAADEPDTRAAAGRMDDGKVRLAVPLDNEASLSLQDLDGDGSAVTLVATQDGTEHRLDTIAAPIPFFGGDSVTVAGADFTPALDLGGGFALRATRGDTTTDLTIAPLAYTLDRRTTTATGTTLPGTTVTLRAEALGVADRDATFFTVTADDDGRFEVTADRRTQGFAPEISVAGAGHVLEGGLTRVPPLLTPATTGAEATLGTAYAVRVREAGADDAVIELTPEIFGTGGESRVHVRSPGTARRATEGIVDVAIRLDTGAPVVPGDGSTLVVSRTAAISSNSGRTSRARIDGELVLCLDEDAPAACDFPLPLPYAVARDVPVGGSLTVEPPSPFVVREVTRAAGENRVATAVALSKATLPLASFFGVRLIDAVVLANSANFPDALAAAPLASAANGLVLLNPTAALDPDVAGELQRLGPSEVLLMGGDVALSPTVEQQVRDALPAARVTRLAGADRYATAALAADEAVTRWETVGSDSDGVLLALGNHPVDPNRAWPDALAAGPLAAAARRPILLTAQDALPAATTAAIDVLDPEEVVVLGGPVAIPEDTVAPLGDDRRLSRIGGQDRYATSTLLADEAFAWGAAFTSTYLATGQAFPDGLAASGAAAFSQGVLVLSPTASLADTATEDWLAAHGAEIDVLRLAGGEVALSPDVQARVSQLVLGTRRAS